MLTYSFAFCLTSNSFYDEIPPNILDWILKQHIFFVASAALRSKPGERAPDNRKNVAGRRVDEWGYVNVSPKEMALFNVVDSNTVWCEYGLLQKQSVGADIQY